ncbi:unnamed protein product [Protopolystoma xenopodis]|uniref:Tyrosine specific protein phosphatases domain-containing protein n=1 Tax=Protopolystoma xenopodis TaxID=117903 RepID=A0A3S4ZSB8_9PLAT|nr:unnamed protein product [Protopolystoma xenopodis]
MAKPTADADYDAGETISSFLYSSAGVGRTGTFIAIDTIMRQIRAGHQLIDIFGVCLYLRYWRRLMVEMKSQYLFIHAYLGYKLKQNADRDDLQPWKRRRSIKEEDTEAFQRVP